MKLGLINASPRGKDSNSAKILGWLTSELPTDVETTSVYAVKAEDQEKAIDRIKPCDYYVIIFPLYTDAMPGIAKKFFENMMAAKASFAEKPVLFIIHSGFPEAAQSRTVARYVKHFAKLINMRDMGYIILGNSEGIRFHPKQASSKRAEAIAKIGKIIPRKASADQGRVHAPRSV